MAQKFDLISRRALLDQKFDLFMLNVIKLYLHSSEHNSNKFLGMLVESLLLMLKSELNEVLKMDDISLCQQNGTSKVIQRLTHHIEELSSDLNMNFFNFRGLCLRNRNLLNLAKNHWEQLFDQLNRVFSDLPNIVCYKRDLPL